MDLRKQTRRPFKTTSKPRIGIYSGTFDPVHEGHIAFALQAIEQANLDEVVFLPERRPRYKQGVEHFGHRTAMLARAIRPHDKLSMLELPDRHFSVKRTLPELRKIFPEAELVCMVGSDVLPHLTSWPEVATLLKSCELLVGVRGDESPNWVTQQIEMLPISPLASHVIPSYAAEVSSGQIRAAIRSNTTARGSLPSVHRYANQNWLYISVGIV